MSETIVARMGQTIAAEIRKEAAEAMRERCAVEADKFGKSRRDSVGWACDRIAIRIRDLELPS